VFTETEWEAFCRALGSPAWAGNKKFASLPGRKENEDELDSLVEQWTVNFTPEEVMSLMQQAGVPSGAVKTNKELFEDPQLTDQGYFQRVEHSEIGSCYQQAWPIRLSISPLRIRPAPCLGEHNEYVYTQVLGLSDQEFVEYLGQGVFE
jgi:crotonobetainyl-CoA:carnitine CoA-transferase CaiB-like acyl-CoA transferase